MMNLSIPPSPFARTTSRVQRAGTPLLHVGKSLFVKGIGPHEHGCLMVLLPDGLAVEVLKLGRSIPDHQLGPGGREKKPHCTVKFGFTSDTDVQELKAVLIRHGPIPIKLEGLSLFEGNEDGDVLKLDIESESLQELHCIVSKSFPCVDTHPEYKPHVTIAYLNPDFSHAWAGMEFPLQGQEFVLVHCEYASASGHVELIPLAGACCLSCSEGRPCEGEKSFTGKKKDKLGRERCYQEGKLVSCATGSPSPRNPSVGEPSEESPGVMDAVRDYRENGTRAKAFKSWFGDFENDSKNASKIVDLSTGEPEKCKPIKVFHGTRQEFTEFDPEKIGSAFDPGDWGAGFYFTSSRSMAEMYAEGNTLRSGGTAGKGKVIEVYLSIKKPLYMSQESSMSELKQDSSFVRMIVDEYGDDKVREWMDPDKDKSVIDVIKREIGSKEFTQLCRKNGYDGLVQMRGDRKTYHQIVAFDPNQIKAVDNEGGFDPASRNMMKSFTGKKEDSAGRTQCYQEGEHVSCATGSPQPQNPPVKKGPLTASFWGTRPVGQAFSPGALAKLQEAGLAKDPSIPVTADQVNDLVARYKERKKVSPPEKAKVIHSEPFKNWFGPWDSDPANASKVVDKETGEPQEEHKVKEVHHGTREQEFSAFEERKIGTGGGLAAGKGYYFAENKEIAKAYAGEGAKKPGKIITAYLNIRNPFDFDQEYSQGDVDKLLSLAKEMDKRFDEGWFLSERGARTSTMKGSDVWEDLKSSLGTVDVNDVLERAGFDGLTHLATGLSGAPPMRGGRKPTWGRIWVAFQPNQVKSVDNQGTFDPNERDFTKALPSLCPICGGKAVSFEGGWRCGSPPCEWSLMAADPKEAVGVKGVNAIEKTLTWSEAETDGNGHGRFLCSCGNVMRPCRCKHGPGNPKRTYYITDRKCLECKRPSGTIGVKSVESDLQKVCESFSDIDGLGPDYQRLFWNPETRTAWWESFDGDDGDGVKEVKRRLEQVRGVDRVEVEAEASPRNKPGWAELWPGKKSLFSYQTKDQGQPCEQGEAASRTGCVPASEAPAKSSEPSQEPKGQHPIPKAAWKVINALRPSSILQTALQAVDKVKNPRRSLREARQKAKERFHKLQARYGTAGACAIAGAYAGYYAVAVVNPGIMLFIPSPSAMLLGSAEVLRYGWRKLTGKKSFGIEEWKAAARIFIADLAEECGEEIPELDGDILESVVEHLYKLAGRGPHMPQVEGLNKALFGYQTKGLEEGKPCTPGHTQERDRCIPENPEVGSSPFVGGETPGYTAPIKSAVSEEMVRNTKAYNKHAEDFVQDKQEYDRDVVHEDIYLEDLFEEIGFAEKPKIVSKEDMDRLVESGYVELFRGASEAVQEQTKTGSFFVAKGMYGAGIYVSLEKGTAQGYAGKRGQVARMTLTKDARIANVDELIKEQEERKEAFDEATYNDLRLRELKGKKKKAIEDKDSDELAKLENEWNKLRNRLIVEAVMTTQNLSRLAVLHGYDAISIPDPNYMLVLNRSKLIVQDDYEEKDAE